MHSRSGYSQVEAAALPNILFIGQFVNNLALIGYFVP